MTTKIYPICPEFWGHQLQESFTLMMKVTVQERLKTTPENELKHVYSCLGTLLTFSNMRVSLPTAKAVAVLTLELSGQHTFGHRAEGWRQLLFNLYWSSQALTLTLLPSLSNTSYLPVTEVAHACSSRAANFRQLWELKCVASSDSRHTQAPWIRGTIQQF